MFAGSAILSYYPVVASWAATYLWRYPHGVTTLDGTTGYAEQFHSIIADPLQVLLGYSLVIVVTVTIVA